MKKSIVFLFSLFFTVWLYAQAPAGYYDAAANLNGAALKTALYNIIKNHNAASYDYLWTAFQTTDIKSNGKVWDMYSDIPGSTPPYEFTFVSDQCSGSGYSNEGDCYNREHSWPASWFNDATPMYTDLFHLIPADGYVNNHRGNYLLGKVNNPGWTSLNGSRVGPCSTTGYSGTVFEPVDGYKGDFARAYFYMVTRYENYVASWSSNPVVSDILDGSVFPAFKTWYIDMLKQWCMLDPVSPKEIARNNAIYAIQNNRNPFIDHPEYIYSIWGAPPVSPEPTTYPGSFSAHNIHLQWTEATGANLPTGYLVKMSTSGYSAITAPSDGVPVADDLYNKNVPYGVHEVWFGQLTPNVTYYFKLFPYRGSGQSINYKTDGAIPQMLEVCNP